MGALLIPILVLGGVIAVLGIIVGFARNYRKCPPNAVLVVYGQKRKMEVLDPISQQRKMVERGYRLVIGGATFVKPMLESCEVINLTVFQEQVKVTDTPNKDGVSVSVEAVANLKISSDPALLAVAVENLLSMKETQLRTLCNSTMEAQLRQLVGTLTIETIITDQEQVAQQVIKIASSELSKLGMTLVNFGIAKISDPKGYIEALGKSRTAQVKRDADVAEAAAKLVGETAKAESEKSISDANRAKDIAIADNKTQVQSREARISIIAQSEAQTAQAELNRQTVAAQVAQVTADTELQKLELKRNEARLDATTVTNARKEAEALVIRSEGNQKAAVNDGEAFRIKAEKEGLGAQARSTGEAEGRKAAATADQAEMVAKAEGRKAELLAAAAGTKAQGEAEGAAKLAVFLAEAEGLLKKNDALKNLSDGARLIMILEKLPVIIEEAGQAGERIVGSAFEHVGAGLARIDEVRILDMGGGKGGDGNHSVANFALSVPKIVAGTLAQFEALGIKVEPLLKMAGIDASKFEGILGNAISAASKTPEDATHTSE